jgi:hypothetical protein
VRLPGEFFQELDLALAEVIPPEPAVLDGEWSASRRRTYQGAQSKPGVGPYVEVVDWTWTGTLVGAAPIAAVAFLATSTSVHWVKAGPAPAQTIRLSLTTDAGRSSERATLGASIGDVALPGVPVAYRGSASDACVISTAPIATGRASALASAEKAVVVLLIIQRDLLKVGRNRLWRVREDLASSFPPHVRELLTRRRSGRYSLSGGGSVAW